jgi:hypothetical protein
VLESALLAERVVFALRLSLAFSVARPSVAAMP